jgi:superfamily II DNA helicase RecQ
MTLETTGRGHDLLEAALGASAMFRDGQAKAIRALVDEQKRVLVVHGTGWGSASSTSSLRG